MRFALQQKNWSPPAIKRSLSMADTPHNEEESSKEINHARSCSLRSAGCAFRGARRADHGHDTHRHSGTARRQDRRLDGTGKLRTVPQVRLLRARLLRKL